MTELRLYNTARPVNRLDDARGQDWRHQAACASVDSELFFPIGESKQHQAQIDDAKAVCHQCPVIDACLQDAIDTRDTWGIRGGLTGEQIQSTIRRRTRKAGA